MALQRWPSSEGGGERAGLCWECKLLLSKHAGTLLSTPGDLHLKKITHSLFLSWDLVDPEHPSSSTLVQGLIHCQLRQDHFLPSKDTFSSSLTNHVTSSAIILGTSCECPALGKALIKFLHRWGPRGPERGKDLPQVIQ